MSRHLPHSAGVPSSGRPVPFSVAFDHAPVWARDVLALAPALIAAAAIYAPTLGLFFAQDDVTFLLRATGAEPTPWSFARPISEGLAWRVMVAAFGLEPAPYHAVRLILHLFTTTLVYIAGRRLLGGRIAAGCAAVVFGASSVGFTALHWASCIVEVLAATLALAAFVLWLEARARASRTLLWISAIVMVGALLSKENTLLLPLVLLVAAGRDGARAALAACAPHLAFASLLVLGFLATRAMFGYGQYTGGDAYALSLAPGFLLANFSTYAAWSVSLLDPIRDRNAVVRPEAQWLGIAFIAMVIALAFWSGRRDRMPFILGIAWFAAFLMPVLPLTHHTYLYYLYLPWAGAAWALVAAARALGGRTPRPLMAATAAALMAGFIGVEARGVRLRESAVVAGLPADKTVRESMLLRNAISDLRKAQLAPGTRVGFVNPFPREHHAIAGEGAMDLATAATTRSYIPLEGAMRGGRSLQLFVPGLAYAGFAVLPPRGWEDVELFLFDNDGSLEPLGRGASAHTRLGQLMIDLQRPIEAEVLLRRAVLLGDESAETEYLLMIAIGSQGRMTEGYHAAREFLARWPQSPHAGIIRSQILPGDTVVPAIGR